MTTARMRSDCLELLSVRSPAGGPHRKQLDQTCSRTALQGWPQLVNTCPPPDIPWIADEPAVHRWLERWRRTRAAAVNPGMAVKAFWPEIEHRSPSGNRRTLPQPKHLADLLNRSAQPLRDITAATCSTRPTHRQQQLSFRRNITCVGFGVRVPLRFTIAGRSLFYKTIALSSSLLYSQPCPAVRSNRKFPAPREQPSSNCS